MGLVTLNQVKMYLNLNTTYDTDDEFLNGSLDGTVTGLITLVSDELEEACGIDIEAVERNVTVDGSGAYLQALPYWPIRSLAGSSEAARLANLQYRASATSAWADLLTDEDLVFFDPERPWALTLLDSNTFPQGDRNVRIQYNSGYATCPADIVLAVLERIAIKYKESKRGDNRLWVTSQTPGGLGGVTQGLTDHQKRWDAIVEKYGRKV
jgi:hypothetical protein